MGIQVINNSSGPIAYLKLLGDVALTSSLVNVVDQANNQSILKLSTINAQFNFPPRLATSGTFSGLTISGLITPSGAGNFSPNIADIQYTIASTGAQTGTINGINLDAIETILGGFTHNLMNLKIGGVSKFSVLNNGTVTIAGFLAIGSGANTLLSSADGVLRLTNSALNNFGRLQLGGTTASFPSIKRNGANIEFKLADDSAFTTIKAALYDTSGSFVYGANYLYNTGAAFARLNGSTTGFGIEINGSTALPASSIFTLVSTTQGFLMPRMTQAQILLILLPANGLQVYNTDLNQPCFYDGTGWRKISHTNM